MSGGTWGGFCSETRSEFYVNPMSTAAQLDVWVKNNGDCNIVIEIATPDNEIPEPMAGVSVWPPGNQFLQTVDVPPHAQFFSCADLLSAKACPAPATNAPSTGSFPAFRRFRS
jgi:hypothetical protein